MRFFKNKKIEIDKIIVMTKIKIELLIKIYKRIRFKCAN